MKVEKDCCSSPPREKRLDQERLGLVADVMDDGRVENVQTLLLSPASAEESGSQRLTAQELLTLLISSGNPREDLADCDGSGTPSTVTWPIFVFLLPNSLPETTTESNVRIPV